MGKVIRGKTICPGVVQGEAVVSRMPISFTGGLDPQTGIIRERGHDLEGVSVRGKILVFPTGKGSTTGSWQFFAAWKRANAPKGMVCVRADGIVAVSAIITGVPLIHELEIDPVELIRTGSFLVVNADRGYIQIVD